MYKSLKQIYLNFNACFHSCQSTPSAAMVHLTITFVLLKYIKAKLLGTVARIPYSRYYTIYHKCLHCFLAKYFIRIDSSLYYSLIKSILRPFNEILSFFNYVHCIVKELISLLIPTDCWKISVVE